MLDIITIGSATMDVFIQTDVKTLKIRLKNRNSWHIPKDGTKKDRQEYISFPLGSKILIKEMYHHTGGGGTNTAITFAKSGLKTGFLGNIGNDHNGELILKELKSHKIKFLGKIHGKTGHSLILDANNDRTALIYKGCNNEMPIEAPKLKRMRARWFYIASVTEKMFDVAKDIVQNVKNRKSKICFNPSSYMTKKGFKFIKPILRKTYCLILNNEEAKLLTKDNNIKNNLKTLSKKIVFEGIVVITVGERGAWVYHNNKIYSIKPKKIKVKETTGAGDAFASGFISGLIKLRDIEFCMKMGMNNAEHTIQKIGAKEGLLGKKLITLANSDTRRILKY
jgi:ribokinase